MKDSVHMVTRWIMSTDNPGDEITTLIKVRQPLQRTRKSDRLVVLTDKSNLKTSS
uniref:Uncharacterized protein n=1 Tax=Arundo donax TaxID=35708 RepID=A0A0A9G442_ARUDO